MADGINALIATGGGYTPPNFDLQTAQHNALANQLMGQKVKAEPFRQELQEQELRLREVALDVKQKAMELTGSGKPISLDYDWGTVTGPAESVASVAQMVAQYPGQVQDPNFMPWVAQQGVSIKGKEAKEPKISPYGPEALSFAEKKAQIEAKYRPPKSGMKVYDAQGNLIVDTGGGEPVSKPTQTKIETEIISGKEQLARMNSIQAEFKPEYLETGTRLQAAWTGVKAKLGQNVPPEDAKKLSDFKKFQRKAIENINKYIKELTGAQMSEKEADRLRLAQPDPGEKWWQGQDPITFKSNMDDVIKSSRAAVARWEYYRAQGLSDAEIKGVIKSDSAIPLTKLISAME